MCCNRLRTTPPPKTASALSLLAQGRLTEAEEACRQALLLDPLLTNFWFNLGRITVGTGRYKEAGEAFRKGLELQPNASRFHTYLATLDILQNRPAQAHGECATRDTKVSGATMPSLWCNKRKATDRQPTLALKDFIAKDSNGGAFQIAVLYAIRKEPDEMFKWLDTAYATRDSGLTQLADNTFLPPLSGRPALHRIVPKAQRAVAVSPDEVMSERNFFAELKRRNVYKVAVAYGVVAWLLMQVASQIFPFFDIPNWVVRLVVLILIIGFPVALIIAWAFEVTPEGIKRTEAADAAGSTISRRRLDLCCPDWCSALGRFVLCRPLSLLDMQRRDPPPKNYGVASRAKWLQRFRTSRSRCCHWSTKAAIRRTNIFRMDYRKN